MKPQKRKEFLRRMKEMRIPYDLGRLPLNMTEKKTLSGLTAEQLKNYILINAKPCLVNLILKKAYDCFCLLSDAVRIINKSFITENDISNLEDILEQHHQLYKTIYGKWEVSINNHMVLHIPDMLRNFGPANGFWCFPFERYNGVLEKIPNNGKSVEQQFMKYFQIDCSNELATVDDISSILPPQYKIPSSLSNFSKTVSYVDDTVLNNHYAKEYACAVYLHAKSYMSTEKKIEAQDVDTCLWPITMYYPKRENLQLTIPLRNELIIYFRSIYDDVQLDHARIHKYGRCLVNGSMFTSVFNVTDKGNIAKAYFAFHDDDTDDEGVAHFYGRILYFFKSKVYYKTNEGIQSKMHDLAYVNWLQFTPEISQLEKKTSLFTIENRHYDCEHIVNVRRLVARCSLSSTHSKRKSHFVVEL